MNINEIKFYLNLKIKYGSKIDIKRYHFLFSIYEGIKDKSQLFELIDFLILFDSVCIIKKHNIFVFFGEIVISWLRNNENPKEQYRRFVLGRLWGIYKNKSDEKSLYDFIVRTCNPETIGFFNKQELKSITDFIIYSFCRARHNSLFSLDLYMAIKTFILKNT